VNFVLLADSFHPQLNKQFYYISVPDSNSGAPQQIHLRHQGRANICFGDGSVRSLNKEEILALDDGWNAKAIREENP
jgi:prepilin-type processing-associated H-X9-DG protein